MADPVWKSKGILFFLYRSELVASAASTFNFALYHFHVVSFYLSAAFLADKYVSKFSCVCFGEFNQNDHH
tara:strand:+ start:1880 stop:2089 length:210 start_codon:yes stop_codon:yes gene_type:complete